MRSSHPSPDPRRAVLAVVVAGIVATIGIAGVLAVGLSTPTPSGTTPAAAPVAAIAPRAEPELTVMRAVSSLAVLRDWDRARARAWSRASTRHLRRLYLPGAQAGERDVAMLRRWRERGWRVRGMGMQVSAVRLIRRTDERLVLIVTDRLVGARAVDPGSGETRELPLDRATTRRLEFRRTERGWVLAAAYARKTEAGSREASPAATTESTSGSANS